MIIDMLTSYIRIHYLLLVINKNKFNTKDNYKNHEIKNFIYEDINDYLCVK